MMIEGRATVRLTMAIMDRNDLSQKSDAAISNPKMKRRDGAAKKNAAKRTWQRSITLYDHRRPRLYRDMNVAFASYPFHHFVVNILADKRETCLPRKGRDCPFRKRKLRRSRSHFRVSVAKILMTKSPQFCYMMGMFEVLGKPSDVRPRECAVPSCLARGSRCAFPPLTLFRKHIGAAR